MSSNIITAQFFSLCLQESQLHVLYLRILQLHLFRLLFLNIARFFFYTWLAAEWGESVHIIRAQLQTSHAGDGRFIYRKLPFSHNSRCPMVLHILKPWVEVIVNVIYHLITNFLLCVDLLQWWHDWRGQYSFLLFHKAFFLKSFLRISVWMLLKWRFFYYGHFSVQQ